MATIAKKCSVCGALYRAYNYVDIPVSRDDDDDQEYDDDEAIDVEVEEDFEPINFEPNGFEFVTIKEDMDIQYDFDNQDLCPECMAAISNFIDTNTPKESGNPVVLYDAAPANAVSVEVTGGNENTIIVRTSKNLARFCPEDNTDATDFDYEVNEPNNIICTKTSSAGKFFAVFKAYLKKDVTYKFSHTINSLAVWLYSNKIWGEQITNFTIGEEGKTYTSDRTGEIVIGCWCPGSATNRTLTDFMICVDTPPLVLRGIPKLDANNNLYYDGDTYEADGTVTRKYGVVIFDGTDDSWDLQSINSYGIANFGTSLTPYGNASARKSGICDRFVSQQSSISNTTSEGFMIANDKVLYIRLSASKASTVDEFKAWLASNPVMLVYELATPTKENAKSFLNPQKVSKYGTEEYVTTGIVPVGHVTKYPVGSQENIDQTPYLYRVSGGGVEVGTVEEDSIVGGTVAWNQLVQKGANYFYSVGGTKTYDESSNTFTVSMSSATNAVGIYSASTFRSVSGHKYFISVVANPSSQVDIDVRVESSGTSGTPNVPANTNTLISKISIGTDRPFIFYCITSGLETFSVTFKNIQIFDLTQMFGSTIADYIYSLEQSSTGAGVAFFRKLFPKDYYEYNTGELMSVEGLQSHDMVGFNQWDEEWEVGILYSNGAVGTGNRVVSKNFIPIIPNEKYCYSKSDKNDGRCAFYDTNKNLIVYYVDFAYDRKYTVDGRSVLEFTTPENARYMKFCSSMAYGTTYNNDICINISSDRNGEYEPYIKHSYPLNDAWDSVYEFSNEKTYTVGDDIRLLTGSNTLTASEGTLTIKYKKAIEGKMEAES